MYGIIPNAKIAILWTAPPANTLNIPSKLLWLPPTISFRDVGSIPGRGT